jgi:hypothetical protein
VEETCTCSGHNGPRPGGRADSSRPSSRDPTPSSPSDFPSQAERTSSRQLRVVPVPGARGASSTGRAEFPQAFRSCIAHPRKFIQDFVSKSSAPFQQGRGCPTLAGFGEKGRAPYGELIQRSGRGPLGARPFFWLIPPARHALDALDVEQVSQVRLVFEPCLEHRRNNGARNWPAAASQMVGAMRARAAATRDCAWLPLRSVLGPPPEQPSANGA